MASPDITAATMQVTQQEKVPGNAAGLTAAPKVKPSRKPAKTLADDRGPYVIVRVQKPDGTIVRAKKRLPSTILGTPSNSSPDPKVAPDVKSAPSSSLIRTPDAPLSAPSSASDVKPVLKTEDKIAPPLPSAPLSTSDAKPVSKPADENAPPNTQKTASASTPVAKSGNAKAGQRLLDRLGGHVITRTAAALLPGWDLGDVEDGDISLDSDDDDDDDYDSDYDLDGNNDYINNATSQSAISGEKSNSTADHGSSNALLGAVAAQSSLHDAGKPEPQKSGTTSAAKDKAVQRAGKKDKTSAAVAKDGKKSGVEVSEKHISDGSDTMEKPPPIEVTKPQRISKSTAVARIVAWSVMIGFPILFIVFGIITTTFLHQKSVNNPRAVAVHRAIPFAVTTWPIVFAAIVAQSLKNLAAWRVERGIRLIRLEQLLSSNTVSSAIKQPFFLRRIDLVSMGLLALWGISPLGSQAIQKIVMTVAGSVQVQMPLYYVDTTGFNIALASQQVPDIASFDTTIDITYGSALLPTDDSLLSGFVDAYSNPLIPVFEDLEKPNDYQAGDWVSVNWDAKVNNTLVPPTITAIFGIPFKEFLMDATAGEITMGISSSYLSFTCSPPTTMTWQEINDLNVTFSVAKSGTLFMSMSDMTNPQNPDVTFLFASVTEYPYSNADLKCTGSSDGDGLIHTNETVIGCYNSTAAFSSCTFSRTWVDSQLDCNLEIIGCKVTKMRITPGSHVLEPMANLADKMVQAEPSYAAAQWTVTERYIMNPTEALDARSYSGQLVNMATLDVNDFTTRLATLVNTYWQIGFSPVHVTGGTYAKTSYNETYEYVKQTNGTYTDASPIYIADKKWAAIFFICASLLLVIGVAAIALESWTIGPNLLGYAALIARQSKYVRIPHDLRTSSAVGSAERARILRNLDVMMQDVRGDDEVGKIALGTVNENSRRLQAGRLYR